MGAIMAVYGVTFAVFQNDMRRLLSYHIISQLGYMVAGIGLMGWWGAASEIGVLGLDGGMAHLFNNVLYKTLLFMAIGVIIWKTGENQLSRIGGLQRKMPVTALVYWIAALSISGVPLFNGFVSKGMVMLAAEHTSLWLWALLAIASFGTCLSFLKLGYFAFLRPGTTEATDPPIPMQAAMIGVAVLCVAIGIYPPLLYAILPLPTTYMAFDPARLGEALLVLGAAAAFFFTIGRRILEPHDTRLKDADVAYIAAGRGVLSFAGGLQNAFRTVYQGAISITMGFFHAGRLAMGLEDRDVNWNSVAFWGALIAVLILVLAGVSS
jgi:multicomponent Na+:H+ antiporter subunit D